MCRTIASPSQTHPDRLATVATLFGMRPAPAERSQVLELGCAGAGNLIPMGAGIAPRRFLGIDLSGRQVADGQKVVGTLGLTNVELKQRSITDVDPSWGHFDYIVCHGVYSWVPPAVQDKILEICATNLAPQGVAYVSYNTYPGWHMRGMLRDIMCYHARRFDDPQARVGQARALLDFLAKSVAHQGGPTHPSQKEVEAAGQAGLVSAARAPGRVQRADLLLPVRGARPPGACALPGRANVAMMGTARFRWSQERCGEMSSNLIHMEQYAGLPAQPHLPPELALPQGRADQSPAQPGAANALLRGLARPAGVRRARRPLGQSGAVKGGQQRHTVHAGPPGQGMHGLPGRGVAEGGAVRDPAGRGPVARRPRRGTPPRHRPGPASSGHLLYCYTSSELVELSLQPPPFTTAVTGRPSAPEAGRLQAEAAGRSRTCGTRWSAWGGGAARCCDFWTRPRPGEGCTQA